MKYVITTQSEVRRLFWELHEGQPGISTRKIRNHAGTGKMYDTDTRCAFVDYVDSLARNGEISAALADRVTLG